MTFYSRNLPHWHPQGAALFLTWRLYGSLPRGTATSGCAASDSPGRRFKLLDNVLDRGSSGPHWLEDPLIAGCLVDTIHRGESLLNHYALHAFVVMPNHVHLLISPQVPVPRITNGIKGVSARDANRILRRVGKHFWQDESFDHWVRTAKEFDRIRAYIEWNPVSASLAAKPEDWKWSSAHPESKRVIEESTAGSGCATRTTC